MPGTELGSGFQKSTKKSNQDFAITELTDQLTCEADKCLETGNTEDVEECIILRLFLFC